MDRIKFFESWTREAAWVYGLILGDGHVMCGAKGGRVYFVGNRDTVEKFSVLMEIPETRLVFKRGVWHAWCDDKPLAIWFRQRGVNAKKSGSLPWPRDIPKAVKWDFVRGIIDTDGALTFNDTAKYMGRGRLTFTLGFSSATLDFVEAFAKHVGTHRKISKSLKSMPSGVKTQFHIHMGMKESLNVCRKFYGDAPFAIRNEERYQKYLRAEALAAEYGKGCQTLLPNGELCGKPIHTGEVCMGHMWAEKRSGRVCEGCGDNSKSDQVIGSFCKACKYRSLRLLKNPGLRTRARRG